MQRIPDVISYNVEKFGRFLQSRNVVGSGEVTGQLKSAVEQHGLDLLHVREGLDYGREVCIERRECKTVRADEYNSTQRLSRRDAIVGRTSRLCN